MSKANFFSGKALVRCTIVSAIVLAIQVYSWATTACQVPNPSTVFCITQPKSQTCASGNGYPDYCPTIFDAFERNQFPDGAVSSKSGTTMQQQADCWRVRYCVYNDNTNTCSSGTTWSAWQQADKTVVNPQGVCPTNEGG